MRKHACAMMAVATGLLAAEGDPAGTISLPLEAGHSAPVTAAPGANVLCDDPAVVAPEYADDPGEFVLRALKPGSTLCGVWLAGQKPGGLYRVVVTARADDAESARDAAIHGGNSDAGPMRDLAPDGGAKDAGPKPDPTTDGGAKDGGRLQAL